MMPLAIGAPSVGGMLLVLAALVIAASAWAVYKGMDVRLALMLAALTLAGMAGDLRPVVRKFLATFSDEKFVVPICSAMGFAYVLRLTSCDQHLVQLLMRPLRKARLFLIPGVVLVGFLVNIPVISQTSTAVCLGAVVVPLMRAAGISAVTIGSTILLGASLGGELLNPGAPELLTVANNQKTDSRAVIPAVSKLVFYHLAIATFIFWWLSRRYERRHATTIVEDAKPESAFRVNYLRALVPIVPLVLLFVTGPPLELFKVPLEWLVEAGPKPEVIKAAQKMAPTRLIGLAMVIGVVVACLVSPRQVGSIPRAFFEGAGYAFASIVSLIVTANCFGVAIEQIGLAYWLEKLIQEVPNLLIPMAAGVPLAFSALSGSGMASTQSLY
ncbi:MAG: C4-dicarboxylate transporter DcuC, partial [Planctomycetes bacterium]|nr:C4-dicarboxylate transporter DcuC [Planctomycetota bacterium]